MGCNTNFDRSDIKVQKVLEMGFLKVPEFYKGKKVLLLQGPRGPFFWKLRKDLKSFGAQVFKINFNGGDWLFYPKACTNYRGGMQNWRNFLERYIQEKGIDIVILFSDWREIHRIAIEICKSKGILVGVFEEGYVRPHYCTLEPRGVNGFSLLSEGKFDLDRLEVPDTLRKEVIPIGNTFWYEVAWAILYFIAANLLRPLFPKYKHHISLYFPESLVKEAFPWILSGIRKCWYLLKERKIKLKISEELKYRYFLVPLQVHNDSQVVMHSPFKDVKDFILQVLSSFSRYAPKGTYLIFKHHPRDRGYRDYTGFIRETSRKLGVSGRVIYLHDAHLPTLIDNSIGVVVINSSVGFQALEHGKPTIVLGKAIYKQRGLVYEGDLDSFWLKGRNFKMDRDLFRRFKSFLIFYSQVNGNLHKRFGGTSYSGLVWEDHDIAECLRILHTAHLKVWEVPVNA